MSLQIPKPFVFREIEVLELQRYFAILDIVEKDTHPSKIKSPETM